MKLDLNKIKANLHPKKIYENLLISFDRSKTEIIVLGVLGTMIGGALSYHNEWARERQIPLAFSERTQIIRNLEADGKQISIDNDYLTSVNDLIMKIFEASNISYDRAFLGDNTRTFAQELEYKIDSTFSHHTNSLQDFLDDTTIRALAVKRELMRYDQLAGDSQPMINLFERSWDDTHTNVYHTECTTDSKGNTECHQEYHHTIHDYDYHKKYGEQASSSIDGLVEEYSDFKLVETPQLPRLTGAENEAAIEVSRQDKGEHKAYSNGELLGFAQIWYHGSTLVNNKKSIHRLLSQLGSDADNWRSAKKTAKSDRYPTYSRSDSGPKEFQVVEKTIDHGRSMVSYIDEMVDSVNYTVNNIDALNRKIHDYISTVLDNEKRGDAKDLKSDIMSMAKELYSKNFNNGFDVQGFRWSMVGMMSLLGTAIGAGLGFGLDYLGERFNIYEKINSNINRRKFR